ncbi:hypothetical protein PDO_5115 [Rhizobium sp. PDO1-076]|uniref:hypothetical protein n=1 Tax=Rhizobium sp. PDO1-076 TaxID=1125979 RepID=UPI00024E30A5|nr:hypothetical protein [Rhizobium sp. PDO1-076]EHS51625.1 hypothetical protein PDO_5115 [Rhizobium sp. PDO1-076]
MKLDKLDAGKTDARLAQALWFSAAGECDIREVDGRSVNPGEVLVSTLYSGISRGTENLNSMVRCQERNISVCADRVWEGRFLFQ